MSKSPWLSEIPSTRSILESVLSMLNVESDFEARVKGGEIKPSEAAITLEKKCHQLYIEYEKAVRKRYQDKEDPSTFEMSLRQSRMARGGFTTEAIIYRLLSIVGIPCETRVRYPEDNGEILDIVVPSRTVLKNDPSRSVIISVKRNVRERWREIVGEAYILRCVHKIPNNIWFATITCNVSDYIVKSMVALDIRVYVPDECSDLYAKYGAGSLSGMFDDLMAYVDTP